jgi:hypothetical protein
MSEKINNEEGVTETQQAPPTSRHDPPDATDHGRRTEIAALEKRISGYEGGMLRWTRIVAAFTGLSAIMAGLYAYSFIESERVFLTVPDVAFANSEPTSQPNGMAIVITIKNVGKHPATEIRSKINAAIFGVKRDLPPEPIDENSLVKPLIIPPIAPDETWRGSYPKLAKSRIKVAERQSREMNW